MTISIDVIAFLIFFLGLMGVFFWIRWTQLVHPDSEGFAETKGSSRIIEK